MLLIVCFEIKPNGAYVIDYVEILDKGFSLLICAAEGLWCTF